MTGSRKTPWSKLPQREQHERPRDLHTLYSRRQLESVLHRERARADRNNCEFSLVLFRVRAQEPRLTMRLARLLTTRVRTIDELGWFDQTCVAALLPYTSGEGARAFAENILQQAQERLIPALCRIYTYPSAWYFDNESEEREHENHGHNGNGNGNGQTNGNGNGNGHSHAGASARHAHPVDGNGNGHSNGNGNGNGHSNGNGNGNGHGNGHAVIEDSPTAVATLVAPPRIRRQLDANDLTPYFLQGVTDGLLAPDAGADGVETLLIRRLPVWKRCIDILGAAAGLIMLSPVMAIAAMVIKITSPGPIIFKQRRAGLGGEPFWIFKFRTMTNGAEKQQAELRKQSEQDGPAFKLRHDPRVTPVGKFLRETSLDELPQLWNVLKGDMSLVGPRPLPMDESAECQRWQRRRLDVTPGLTCIWQVKGRSVVTFSEWMRMDVNYIRRRSLWRDVKLMVQTIPAVILRRGAR